MEGKQINIDNNCYISISDLFFETDHYFLVNQLDENSNPTDNYSFLIEVDNEEYELINDEQIKSLLAKLFLPLIKY